MSVGTMLVLTAASLMLFTAGSVQGGITSPKLNEIHYLKTGDQLKLVCEQTPSAGNRNTTIVWSKARGSNFYQLAIAGAVDSKPVLDHDLSYQTLDTSSMAGRTVPYTISESIDEGPRGDGTGLKMKQISELIVEKVTTLDSGYYRCRLGYSGVSSRILVSVIDIKTSNTTLERVHDDAHLDCLVTDDDGSANYSVTWYKVHQHDSHNFNVNEAASTVYLSNGRPKYEFSKRDDGTNVLTVKRVADNDVGIYHCAVTFSSRSPPITLKQSANLFANPHVRHFQQSRNVIRGHSLDLVCQAWGWPAPKVTWYRGQTELNSLNDSRVRFENLTDVINAKLIIDNIGSSDLDRNHYKCVATPIDGERGSYEGNNATIFVRVKDRMAALWPLLGIAVEAIILLVIITTYEMNRKKTKSTDDESSADAQTPAAKSSNSTTGNCHSAHATPTNDDSRRRKN